MIILFIGILYISCNKQTSSSTQSDAFYRGESVYKTVCVSCHNRDPRKVGALAPDIAGSELEVIRSMIMTGIPPEGISKKWPEHTMAPLPNLKDKIPDLYEYLKAFK